jgi:hypothetical protein
MINRTLSLALVAAGSLTLAAFAGTAFAQTAPADPTPAKPAAATGPLELPPPPPGKGQVVFYRKPLFSLIPFNWIVREGTTEICEMEASTYCVAPATPGTHTYEVHSEAKNDLTLEVDAGETYYVIGGISMGLIVNHPNITPADKAQFDALSAKLKPLAPIVSTAASGAPVAPDAATKPAS